MVRVNCTVPPGLVDRDEGLTLTVSCAAKTGVTTPGIRNIESRAAAISKVLFCDHFTSFRFESGHRRRRRRETAD